MPANAVITLPDSQATPVDHDFSPVRISNGIASYMNYAETNEIGRETLELSISNTQNLRKVVAKLRVPRLITEVINSVNVPSVPDYALVKCEFFVPKTWDEADIEDVVELFSQLWQQSVAVGMVDKGEFVW